MQVLKSIAEKPVPQNNIEKFLVAKMFFLCLAIRDFIRGSTSKLLQNANLKRSDFNTDDVKSRLTTFASLIGPKNGRSYTEKFAEFSNHLNNTDESIYRTLIEWLKNHDQNKCSTEHPLLHALKGKIVLTGVDEDVNNWFD